MALISLFASHGMSYTKGKWKKEHLKRINASSVQLSWIKNDSREVCVHTSYFINCFMHFMVLFLI
jgi:endonuclease IV